MTTDQAPSDPSTYTVTRDITLNECPWLEADVPKGARVYPYRGATYGCVSGGGLAVTAEPGVGPFFELPRAALSTLPTPEPSHD